MIRRKRVAALGGLLAGAITASVAALALMPAGAAGPSEVTRKGTGEFSNLAVTVSKTQNLINETVEVTWKGGTPSTPGTRPFRNFLQIMECWGDDGKQPTPEQCQFGALWLSPADPIGTGSVAGRQLSLRQENDPNFPTDPKQPIEDRYKASTGAFMPFRPISGATVSGSSGRTEYFGIQSTNEIPIAATRPNGTGIEYFEVQTATEAPGLGCGNPIAHGRTKTGRGCYLVVVPRSNKEVDGSIREGADSDPLARLQSSPLSATNWANRIVFPLGFQPIGGNCPLGAGQLTVLGGEPATEAISAWQTSLCQTTKSVFDYNQVPDTTGRSNLAGPRPGLAVLGGPMVNPPSTGAPVYAPITVSGLGIASNIEIRHGNPDEAPPQVKDRLSRRDEDINLTPRLVAKLLTQSYVNATNSRETVPGTNPVSLEADPEFRKYNPIFAIDGVNGGNPAVNHLTVSLNPADATALVWQWIAGDADARAFLAGKPDGFRRPEAPDGMVINSLWKGFDPVGRSDFPQLDQTCKPAIPDGSGTPPDLCPSNTHPYASDMHEAVRAALRGDMQTKTNWDATATPPAYKADSPQFKGRRALMAVSDSATAARFHLPMVRLLNASGKFVAPNATSLAAGLAAMKKTAINGVLAPNPGAKGANVYPLTYVSYAVAVPGGLSPAARTAYAGFMRYAAGSGQQPGVQPGQLPLGYLPLTKALRAAALNAANVLAHVTPATPTPSPKPTRTSTGAGNDGASGPGGSGTAPTPASTPGSTPESRTPTPDPNAAVPTPDPPQTDVAPAPAPAGPGLTPVVGATPATPTGGSAKALLWLFLVFGLAVLGTQMLPRLRTSAPRRRPPGGDAGA